MPHFPCSRLPLCVCGGGVLPHEVAWKQGGYVERRDAWYADLDVFREGLPCWMRAVMPPRQIGRPSCRVSTSMYHSHLAVVMRSLTQRPHLPRQAQHLPLSLRLLPWPPLPPLLPPVLASP